MLKLAVRASSYRDELSARLAGAWDRRRGLTLVEYVLGAAFVAAIALLLGPSLIGLAGRAWSGIDRAFNQSS
jgi:hypothetical protein